VLGGHRRLPALRQRSPRKGGQPQAIQNLFGVTLGTGLAAGIAATAELFLGDIRWRARSGCSGISSNPMNAGRAPVFAPFARVYAE